MILDTDRNYTLRPMHYSQFYDAYKTSRANNWEVEEVSFARDKEHLQKLSEAERHMIYRLVAFFATGDNIVGENLVLNLYKHVNSPEVRLYYSRQIDEEALHVDFYLKLLEEYIPDEAEQTKAFDAINNIPSIKMKADFCFKYIDSIREIDILDTVEKRKQFLLNLICFAACIEGLFFYGAFAYVYYMRSKGLLDGLGVGTNWVFRDESMHMATAFELVKVIKHEYPELWDEGLINSIYTMMEEAIECEFQFAKDTLQFGILGLNTENMLQYLQYSADQRLQSLGLTPVYNVKNPYQFMVLQDIQEITKFFEKRVAAYQQIHGAADNINFNQEF